MLYAQLDADGAMLTYDEFDRMGLNRDDRDNIRFLFEPNLAAMKNGVAQFFSLIDEWRPAIVIIDPFARLKQIADFNDYASTYLMGMLSEYSKRTNCHFALPGHIPRGRPSGAEAATAAFGSIAFGGGVNARFVVERKPDTDVFVLKTSKGKSAGFVPIEGEAVLNKDQSGRLSLGGGFSFGQQARAIKPVVLRYLQDAPEQQFNPSDIANHMQQRRALVAVALNMLHEDGEVDRLGRGQRGAGTKPRVSATSQTKMETQTDQSNTTAVNFIPP